MQLLRYAKHAYRIPLFQVFFQLRFGLSSCKEWGAEDGNFILERFYKMILELFEDMEDEWVIETLAWWNACVSILFLLSYLTVFYMCRKIFPDKSTTKNGAKDGNGTETNPNSAHSKAKQACLARARNRELRAQDYE